MTPAELELLIDKIMEETHPSKKRESFYGSRATQYRFSRKLILQNNGSSSIDKKLQ
jgi:hypothetical protein